MLGFASWMLVYGMVGWGGRGGNSLTPFAKGEFPDGKDPDDDFDVLEIGRVCRKALLEKPAGSGAS